MIKTLIVEDQRITRDYIRELLEETGRYTVVDCLSDASLAFPKCEKDEIELVVMDVYTSGSKDGIDATEEIKAKHPNIKVVIVTSMVECGYLDRAKKAGADSFWYKNISKENLMGVIDQTMNGKSIYPEKTPSVMIGEASSEDFTKTEIKILRLIIEGLEYDEIAERLNCSLNTVKTHITHILAKTGHSNRTRLVIDIMNKNFIIAKN
ncbi:MAG: response regulator transcription factor [Bacilli bacterium]|nr:response regulator transcription factor [Bacilli bacterium]